jgi:hypothetical protein
MFSKFISRLRKYMDTHEATKGRPKLFQSIVLLIVIVIISFIIAKLKNWGPFNS